MFLPHFDVFCDLLPNRRTATWNLFVLYNKEINYYRESFFISKSFNIAHFGKHKKKPFDVIYCLYKMKQSHWLLCVAKNCDWSRKITLLSRLNRAVGLKQRKQNRTVKSANLKEMLEKSSQFFVIRAAL